MTTPLKQKALLLRSKQGEFSVGERDVPKPGVGEVLVKNVAIGLNPLDYKIQALGIIVQDYPAVIGVDASGIVADVGEGVSDWKPGDKVIYEGDVENDHATYQQYTLVSAKLLAKIPEAWSMEEAAALPLAVCTAAVGLYHAQGGPRFVPPWQEGGKSKYAGTPVVIMGGATSNGSLAIQWAKLSGFSPIITTASPRNGEYLRKFGATHILDRALDASDLLIEVSTIAGGKVSVVYDGASNADTQNAAFDLLAPGGKLLIVSLNAVREEKKAKAEKEGENKAIVNVLGVVQIPFLRAFGEELFAHLSALLENDAFKPLHVEVLPGGLSGITEGLDRLKQGTVSAQKLVVRVEGI